MEHLGVDQRGLIKEILLNQIAVSTLIGVGVLFALAVIVGWIVAGRALRPITAITAVAEEIEATDLTRRIEVEGHDDELTAMATTFNGMLDRLDSVSFAAYAAPTPSISTSFLAMLPSSALLSP